MAQKLKRGDLAKLGSQFVVVYQTEPLIVMPILLRNPSLHRTDVAIQPAELFCLKKPEQDSLTIKLIEAKLTEERYIVRVGRVSKASLARIDVAIERERDNQAMEAATREHAQRHYHRTARHV